MAGTKTEPDADIRNSSAGNMGKWPFSIHNQSSCLAGAPPQNSDATSFQVF